MWWHSRIPLAKYKYLPSLPTQPAVTGCACLCLMRLLPTPPETPPLLVAAGEIWYDHACTGNTLALARRRRHRCMRVTRSRGHLAFRSTTSAVLSVSCHDRSNRVVRAFKSAEHAVLGDGVGASVLSVAFTQQQRSQHRAAAASHDLCLSMPAKGPVLGLRRASERLLASEHVSQCVSTSVLLKIIPRKTPSGVVSSRRFRCIDHVSFHPASEVSLLAMSKPKKKERYFRPVSQGLSFIGACFTPLLTLSLKHTLLLLAQSRFDCSRHLSPGGPKKPPVLTLHRPRRRMIIAHHVSPVSGIQAEVLALAQNKKRGTLVVVQSCASVSTAANARKPVLALKTRPPSMPTERFDCALHMCQHEKEKQQLILCLLQAVAQSAAVSLTARRRRPQTALPCPPKMLAKKLPMTKKLPVAKKQVCPVTVNTPWGLFGKKPARKGRRCRQRFGR